MMEIYLDKDFARNFWASQLSNTSIWKDFKDNFLNQVRYFNLITNYASEDEMLKSENGRLFYKIFSAKVRGIKYTGEINKNKWVNDANYSSGGYKFYLIEFTDSDLISISNKGYEIISTTTLEDRWSNYLIKKIDKAIDIPANQSNPDLFNSWKDLKIVSKCPTNSIIIIDNYILCDTKGQRIEDNLIPALDNLVPQKHEGTLDVLIVSEKIQSNVKSIDISTKAKEIHDQLIKYFEKYPSIEFKFKILIHDKTFHPEDGMEIHDRIIFTNYYTLTCGVGFNLFNGRKRKCVNSEVQIRFNFQPYEMQKYPRHLISLKKYIAKVLRTEVVPGRFKFYPDVDCKLLE